MIGKKSVVIGLKTGSQVVYSKYAGTEVELNGSNHLILKEDDVVGILETDDIKDLKPQNDRVLIKVVVAEEKTSGGLYLTDASKEKPSIGTAEDLEWDEFGNDLYAIPETIPVQLNNTVQNPSPVVSKEDEDSKIKALIDTPALDWQRQPADGFGSGRGFGRGMGGRMMGERGFCD